MTKKLLSTLALLALAVAMLLSPVALRADSLSVVLTQSTIGVNTPGSTVHFFGTVSAPITNTSAIYLNGDTLVAPSPLTGDDSPFLNNAPFFVNPGQSFTFGFFDVFLPLNTPQGDHIGFFSMTGGANPNAQIVLATVKYDVSNAPEPSSVLLLGTGLTGLFGAVRRRPCN